MTVLSAAIGIFTASIVSGGKISRSVWVNVLAAIAGGTIGGFILSLLV